MQPDKGSWYFEALGSCGIPAGIWKYGGVKLASNLYKLVLKIWETEEIPQDWKDANIPRAFLEEGK